VAVELAAAERVEAHGHRLRGGNDEGFDVGWAERGGRAGHRDPGLGGAA
jgi:hypothetical protein